MRCSAWLVIALTACGASPPTRPPAELVAAGERAWLAGDLPGAIRALRDAGDDPRAQSLLVHALVLTDQRDEARRVVAHALGAAPPDPSGLQLPPEVADTRVAMISPDGAYVATVGYRADQRHSITVWRTTTGQALFTIPLGLVGFGATADGAPRIVNVVQRSGPETIDVYDVRTGMRVVQMAIQDATEIRIDAHGVLLSFTKQGELTRWDLATGAKLGSHQLDGHGERFAVSNDGQTVSSGPVLYDLARGARLASVPPRAWPINALVSADGQLFAVAIPQGSVELYDRRGALLRTIEHAGSELAMLADGTMLTFDGTWLDRWDVHTGAQLARTKLPDGIESLSGDWLAIGKGGQGVARQRDRLAVMQLVAPTPIVIGRLGGPVQPHSLAWSVDGLTLSATSWGESFIETPAAEVLDWRLPGAVVARRPSHDDQGGRSGRTLDIHSERMFVRAADQQVERMVQASEQLRCGVLGLRWIAAIGRSGALHLWNAETAEGMGELSLSAAANALALRNDDRTLAVALETGDIELWDLPSRQRLLRLAIGHDGWMVLGGADNSRQLDGSLDGAVWSRGDLALPESALAIPRSPGLATIALAHPPAPQAFTPVPTPKLSAPACVPQDGLHEPRAIVVSDHDVTYCFDTRSTDPLNPVDPLCFAAEIGPQPHLTPVWPPIAARLEPQKPSEPGFTAEPAAGGVTVCDHEQHCKPLPVHVVHHPLRQPINDSDFVEAPTDNDEISVSDDGAVVAIRHPPTSVVHASPVETWDVATGKRIAQFVVQFPLAGELDQLTSTSIQFLGHTIVAMFNSGIQGTGTLYSARGRRLARYPVEINTAEPTRFHDNVWLLHGYNIDFALFDEDTGRVTPSPTHTAAAPDRAGWLDLGPNYIATATGDGELAIYDRQVHRVARLRAPFCATRK